MNIYSVLIFFNFWAKSVAQFNYAGFDTRQATCQNCHWLDQDRINVHIVPHSHDDVGWLQTFENYYYGSRQNSKNNVVHKTSESAGVQYIITTVVEALLEDASRRFIQVETAFFWKWWLNQEETVRDQVRTLVNNGQLEIINGGYTMNDEACTNYQAIIDQFTWGFRILNDTLGECARPKIGWQIDPFGHSREHASLLNQMGFQGLVLGRIHDEEKTQRRKDKNLDFIWKTSDSLDNPNFYTTIFPDFYDGIGGLCFDVTCYRKDQINEQNVQSKIDTFVKKMNEYKNYYKTSNFLVPIGGDFHYQEAGKVFESLDFLLKSLEDNSEYNVFYSTPSCYVKAVHDEVNKRDVFLNNKTLDFFPYGTDTSSWTGYFTSRPTSKRLERFSNNILQVAKQLAVIAKVTDDGDEASLVYLREAMGIMQHHDAITGTEKQFVAGNYNDMLLKGIELATRPLGAIISRLVQRSDKPVDLQLSLCLLSNISICDISTEDQFIVAVYNPLTHHSTHYVRLPVNADFYSITGPNGEEVYDIFKSISDFGYVKEKQTPSKNELVFAARRLPPLGFKLYHVERLYGDNEEPEEDYKSILSEKRYFGTESNGFTMEFGKLKSITVNEETLEMTQEFLYYDSKVDFRPSGAYHFASKKPHPEPLGQLTEVIAKRGRLVDEVLQVYNDQLVQIIRVYKGQEDQCVEFDWLVGNLKPGQEVVTRYSAKNFHNNGTFYTDSNGREMIIRQLNTRDGYDYPGQPGEPNLNYYPITSKILLRDEMKMREIAVLNDRSQGGSSLEDGTIEIMLHRRTVRDDGWGVNEVLNEKEYGIGIYARGQHWLTFGQILAKSDEGMSTAAFQKLLAQKKLMSPLVLLGPIHYNLKTLRNSIAFQFAEMQDVFPENVQILTFEPWRDDLYLLRLEHIFEKDEDVTFSQSVTVSLDYLFTDYFITDIGETTLGANEWWDEYNLEEKLTWFGYDALKPLSNLSPDDPLKISLKPMQIRTFLLKLAER